MPINSAHYPVDYPPFTVSIKFVKLFKMKKMTIIYGGIATLETISKII
jgi:hypothetical protein